ncbi:MAG: DUF2971 domain-containing protein [Prosthecobacter sp.]
MILYKYLSPDRLDVVRNRTIRFTQPSGLNDPFECKPPLQSLDKDPQIRSLVEERFEELVEAELKEYGSLFGDSAVNMLRSMSEYKKLLLPAVFQMMDPTVIDEISPFAYDLVDLNIGILCLSEVRDSVLMWGHYTNNHQGFVVGFDSNHSFFSQNKSRQNHMGCLQQVEYKSERPQVTLSDVTSKAWFLTKSEHWSYEKEWRIVRPLLEADHRLDTPPSPVCLFNFPPEAVCEIIVGMRSSDLVTKEVRSMAGHFPNAELFRAHDNSSYRIDVRPF